MESTRTRPLLSFETLTAAAIIVAVCGALILASTPALALESMAEAVPPWSARDVQVNLSTASRQEQVAVDLDSRGQSVVAWASRRQEAGTYGVLARRMDALGRPMSDEVRVNQTLAGAQFRPSVAVAEDGSSWLAWESLGAEGRSAVLVRRFDADLRPLTDERFVDAARELSQASSAIAIGGDGRALVVWSEVGAAASSIRTRLLGADGSLLGSATLSEAPGNNLPTVEALPEGGFLVVWARRSRAGSIVVGRRLGASGEVDGPELALSPADGWQIEPTLGVGPGGHFAVAWLRGSGEGYGVSLRLFDRDGQPRGETRTISPPGVKSGLALAMAGDGRFAVSYHAHDTDDLGLDRPESRLVAQIFASDGRLLEPERPLSRHASGATSLASGARRSAWAANGPLVFAWSGDAGQGDTSGANLTLRVPAALEAPPPSGGIWQVAPEVSSAQAVPVWNPNFERLRPLPPEMGAGGDFGFEAVLQTGWTPPDPEMAVGIDRIVVMTNGRIAAFDKLGNEQWFDEIENSFGFWGALGADNFVFDPEVTWDPHDQRFVAMANERSDDSRSYFLLAVSKDATPDDADDWHKYRLDVTALSDNDIDSPNLGVNRDFVFLTADFFGPDKYLLYILDKAPLLAGGAVSSASELITGSGQQSMGVPTVQSDTSDLYILQAGESSINSSLIVHAITDPLTSYNRQTFTLPVPTYRFPGDPVQQGSSTRPELFEPRIWSVVESGGSLWAVHHVNDVRSRVRWYEIALNGWPASGSPSLFQHGEIDLGEGIYTFFPSIFADGAGNAAITFARSAANEFISIGRALRAAGDPAGTLRPVQVVQTSQNPTGGRWGDYSATHSDPATPGSFWGHHEFSVNGVGSWRTWLARYDLRATPMLLSASFVVTGATPGATVRFYASSTGTGLTEVPAMNVTLSLEGAVEIDAVVADGSGVAALSVPVPGGSALIQAAEDGLTTNWTAASILFADGFESGDVSAWSGSAGDV